MEENRISDHLRRDETSLVIKPDTKSIFWNPWPEVNYTGFRVYNQQTLPEMQEWAVCMNCFYSHHDDIRTSPEIWEIKYGTSKSTSKLEKHIEHKHKEIFSYLIQKKHEKKICLVDQSENTIDTDQEQFDDLLVDWIASEMLPLTTVQSPIFKDIINLANTSRYNLSVMGRDTLRTKILLKRELFLQKIKLMVEDQSISATLDGWTSGNLMNSI